MKNNKDVDSLSHTTWRCQYHVVFAPKYRRMVIYGQIKKDIGQILRKLCEQKDIEIIEGWESVRFASERSRVRIPLGPPICRIVLYDAAFFMPKKLWQTVPGSEP